jgi:hypothetical protein
MNEREPTKEPSFDLHWGKEVLRCTPKNTKAYLYENEEYDHLFYITEETETGYLGYHFYRKIVGEHFDMIIKKMINDGYDVYSMDEISEEDLEAYHKACGKEPETHEVSQRGENKIAFLKYILEKELLVADDFNGSSELYI